MGRWCRIIDWRSQESLKLTLAYSPYLSFWVIHILLNTSVLALGIGPRVLYALARNPVCVDIIDDEGRSLVQRLDSFLFDSLDELVAGGDIVDEANDLPSCPNLKGSR